MNTKPKSAAKKWLQPLLLTLVGVCAMLMFAGCAGTKEPASATGRETPDSEPLKMREGDHITIAFPGSPGLNTSQQIRRDGRINLPVVGEVVAAGMTTAELEQELIKLYDKELVSKVVTVTIQTSGFPVFVTGAVSHAGKVLVDRPMTVLEAIMEAGGFDYAHSDLKHVQITRNNQGRMEHYTLNLKRVLQGEDSSTFYVKPSDIIFVPEKFNWF